jgi:glycosyltransferase involved in cell wall biosynthesis
MTPLVDALYRPSQVNGVAAAGARAARLAAPWRPILVGEALTAETTSKSPLFGSPDLDVATWPTGSRPATQVEVILNLIQNRGSQVVVPNDLPAGFIAASLLHHRGVRCAAWIHSDHLDGEDLIARCGELADAWAAVTPAATRRVLRVAAEQGLQMHQHSDPVWVCTTLPTECAPLPADGPIRLLFAGRLERMVKRADDLVPLVEALQRLGTQFQLTIAGDGPASEQIAARLKSSIDAGLVRLAGVIPLHAMGHLIAEHDATLLLSLSEGMPNVIMESFAQGRGAFVTSGCGGAAQLIDNSLAGFVTPTGDMNSMAEVIHRASLHRPMLAAMGQAARRIAATTFDASVCEGRYSTLIAQAQCVAEDGSPCGRGRRWRRMLRALTGIPGATSADARRLWRTWRDLLGDPTPLETPFGEDHFALPNVPSPAELRLSRALKSLEDQGAHRIAVYGAGRHTMNVAMILAKNARVVAICDDRAGIPGGPPPFIGGLPVVSPNAVRDLSVDAVIVSSDEYERELLRRAGALFHRVHVTGLYGSAA